MSQYAYNPITTTIGSGLALPTATTPTTGLVGTTLNIPQVATPSVQSLKLNPTVGVDEAGNFKINAFGGNNISNTTTTPGTDSGGIGWNLDTLGTVFQGLNALSGLANAYLGFKNYGLAKDQFGFAKAATNRTIANQAKQINNAYDNAAQVAAGMIGGTDAYGNYGMTNQEVVDRYAAKAKEKHVDGSAI